MVTVSPPVVTERLAPRWTLLSAGVPTRLAGAALVAAGLWLAVAWALDWV